MGKLRTSPIRSHVKMADYRRVSWCIKNRPNRSEIATICDGIMRNGNPQGFGISSAQKVPNHVISAVDKLFNSPFGQLNGAAIKIRFDQSGGIIIDNMLDADREKIRVPGGRFIARTCGNAFRENSQTLGSLTVPYSQNREWEGALRTFLELGMAEKVIELKEFLRSSAFNSSGFTVGMNAAQNNSYVLLPGTYKHYTDKQGYFGIKGDGMIRGCEKEEKRKKDIYVYLSQLTLRPKEALSLFWTEWERQTIRDRSEYVINFDLKSGSPVVVDYTKGDPFIECWVRGNLPLDQVDVRYMGKNDPKYFPVPVN